MVDFKKLAEESYARATPEEKARMDAYRAKEAEANATARPINAKFERQGTRAKKQAPFQLRRPGQGTKVPETETYVIKAWEREIPMRIEKREGRNGEVVEILAFKEAVTGYESYTLDEDLIKLLLDPKERERTNEEWYLCAGGMGWDSCRVAIQDIEDYLRDIRPNLFEDQPTLSMGM